MRRINQAAVFSIALLLAALAASCTDAPTSTTTSTSTGGGGGAGGMTSSSTSSTSSSSSGGSGGDGGAGGAGGSGGSMATSGHTAMELVSGGEYMKSANYSMVYTVGQPTQIQTTTKSPSYQMQGGLIGAHGSLP